MKLVESIEVEQKRGTEIRSSIPVYCFSYHHAIMQDCGITNDGMDATVKVNMLINYLNVSRPLC